MLIVKHNCVGHSLGLSHSDVKDAIMYSYYRGWDPNMKLREKFIVTIRRKKVETCFFDVVFRSNINEATLVKL
jgi:hypothetical protein